MNSKQPFIILLILTIFIKSFANFDQYPTVNINSNRITFVKIDRFIMGKDHRMIEFGYSISTPQLKLLTSNYYFSNEMHDNTAQIVSDIVKDVVSLNQPCIIKVNSRYKYRINQDLIDLIVMWEKW